MELKKILPIETQFGGEVNDSTVVNKEKDDLFNDIVAEVDEDHDGQVYNLCSYIKISFEEFKKMMNNFTKIEGDNHFTIKRTTTN